MQPRPILPGATYVISRRVSQRMFRLVPSNEVNSLMLYAAAIAQERSNVEIHAICVMSNHYHIALRDPFGKLPVFTETFNKLVAKALNCLHKRQENFWSGSSQVSHVIIGDEAAMLKQLGYIISNPVAAGLVRKSSDWPGVLLWTPGRRTTQRPSFYFRTEEQGGKLPKTATLTLSTPDSMLGTDSQEASIRVIKQHTAALQADIRAQHKNNDRAFLGIAAVKKVNPLDSPNTPFKEVINEDIELNPKVSAVTKSIKKQLLAMLNIFVNEYRDCLADFKAGIKNVVFPSGTYRMAACFEQQTEAGSFMQVCI